MRERLIELIEKGQFNYYASNGSNGIGHNEYIADYLLANGVIVPPCKVGDKIYFTYNEKVFNLTVEKIVIKEEGMFLVDKEFNDWYSIKKLGKTLYLTQEEAEKALNGGAE